MVGIYILGTLKTSVSSLLVSESHFTLLTLPFNLSVMLYLLMNSDMTMEKLQ